MDGLCFMHDNAFAHRDLKPENILLDEQEGRMVAKIADVGMSKLDRIGNMQSYAGSFVYMAPELWVEEDRGYTKAVDVWSLGVMALELFTDWDSILNDFPRSGLPGARQHNTWLTKYIMPRLTLAPAEFQQLLTGLLVPSPEDRWSASEAREWLRHLPHEVRIQAEVAKYSVSSIESDGSARHVRSVHPTLSTTRADNASLASSLMDGEASVPDTDDCGSAWFQRTNSDEAE
ncbi:hypothetical protein ED733_000393 [Metarhizium rileyi]|uniref:Autophagy-related protein 1 n=1 Tax=Metarhizium rileyi (strain RCEF 4871) TaxID=1649241 RepID=A0A5C6G2L1_METRR|nr:hypothetical protein ED733_000393 [Metarhizium rileyi]